AGAVRSLLNRARFGKTFRQVLHEKLTRMVSLRIFLEQLPDANNRVTIDPSHRDLLGNYLPVFNYGYDTYTLDGALAAIGTFWPTVLEKTGIQDQTDFGTVPRGFQSVTHRGQTFNVMGPGHIVGTHRMGRSTSTSVVDPNLRSWSHENLYFLGAGSMVT